jgi:putative membrane protein
MGGWAVMWWWPALVLLGLVLLGVTAAAMIRSRPGGTPGSPDVRSAAAHLLDERFARGEIDEDEYRARRAALQ